MTPADTMVLFRSAAKQVMRRLGCHVTFMCRPKIPEVMSSGWHLHQSLRDPADGRNLFIPQTANASAAHIGHYLSDLGARYVGGLLAHAAGAAAFTTPTINGYRRYRPNSLAPDRAIWGCDNRGAMLRVMGGAGDPASRVENRVGEPAANPYLYMASQIFAGLEGIAGARDPGPSADVPYETVAPRLPTNLPDALAALDASSCMREGFGGDFVDYYIHIKNAELARFNAEVTEWEQREYFEMY
jgi:glutamine synthetase